MSAECNAENIPPSYKQTEVGVIPEDWSTATLSQHCSKLNVGFVGVCEPYYTSENNGIMLIRTGNLYGQKFTFQDLKYVTHSFHELNKKSQTRKGDILIARHGSSGSAVLVPYSIEEANTLNIVIIRTIANELDNVFAQYAINSDGVRKQVLEVTAGSTQGVINTGEIAKLIIPKPTIDEQRAIAKALSDTDALIESLEQLIVKKRQIKQGAMQELLTGKRRLPGFSAEWETKPLDEVIDSCSSGATPYRGHPEYYKGKVKWITSGELNYNLITDTLEHISDEAVEYTNLKVHPVGTFLMAITGLEAAGTRGACGIVGSPATTNQSCMAIYPTSELKTEYLYHYYVFRGNELALQYCQGTKQQSYTAKLVKLLPIDLPPTVEEQIAISDVLSDMDSEITSLEEKLSKARQIKQGMMQELLTGRIRLL